MNYAVFACPDQLILVGSWLRVGLMGSFGQGLCTIQTWRVMIQRHQTSPQVVFSILSPVLLTGCPASPEPCRAHGAFGKVGDTL